MPETKPDYRWILRYALLVVGFLFLLLNHVTVVMGDPWLIPTFMRLY